MDSVRRRHGQSMDDWITTFEEPCSTGKPNTSTLSGRMMASKLIQRESLPPRNSHKCCSDSGSIGNEQHTRSCKYHQLGGQNRQRFTRRTSPPEKRTFMKLIWGTGRQLRGRRAKLKTSPEEQDVIPEESALDDYMSQKPLCPAGALNRNPPQGQPSMPEGSKGATVSQGINSDPREDPREKNTKSAACGRTRHWRGDAACEKSKNLLDFTMVALNSGVYFFQCLRSLVCWAASLHRST